MIDLPMLNHTCDPGMNPSWSWWMIFSMHCEWCLLFLYWEFLHVCSLGILACSSLFSGVFTWFWYQGDVGPIEWIQTFPSFSIFGNSLRIGIKSSLRVWQNLPVKPSGPAWVLLIGTLSLLTLFPYWVSFCSKFLFPPVSILVVCMFLGI